MERIITDIATLGRLVKAARMAQRLTRDEVSLATGLSPAFISDVEAGKETAQVGKVLMLMTELGMTVTAAAPGIDALFDSLESGKNRRLRK